MAENCVSCRCFFGNTVIWRFFSTWCVYPYPGSPYAQQSCESLVEAISLATRWTREYRLMRWREGKARTTVLDALTSELGGAIEQAQQYFSGALDEEFEFDEENVLWTNRELVKRLFEESGEVVPPRWREVLNKRYIPHFEGEE